MMKGTLSPLRLIVSVWMSVLLWPVGVRSADHVVEISNFTFVPSQLTIQVGDTVTWVQRDGTQHTATSGVNGNPDGVFDSPFLNLNQTFSHTFSTAGTFPYFCRPHTFMTGTIVVEGEQQPTLPVVTMTAPSNNTVLLTPGPVELQAEALATGTTVASVEFFDGETSLGVVTTSPYTLTANLSAGTHIITARVTDGLGSSATSAPITITVESDSAGVPIEDPLTNRIAKGDHTVELELVAEGLTSPLGLVAPNDGSGRLFVYDQIGLVRVIQDGVLLETPLLDVRDRLVPLEEGYDERGLLGLAVHPNFSENPLIYTYTSEPAAGMADFMVMLPEGQTNDHQSVIAEWRIDPANTNQVDTTSRREILRIDQPQSNHNGGTLRFGPDGYLYVSLGDGGGADDEGPGHSPGGNGQDRSNILGNLIRLDVNGRTSPNGQYAIPADNPFVEGPELDEIYASGFRNPYSFSFDALTGDLYLADVGQNAVEEVNLVTRGGNYGWPVKEGAFFFDPNGTDAGFVTSMPVGEVPAGLLDPIAQYDHDDGLAVIGGFVYRGQRVPSLAGRYITGDLGPAETPSGRLFYLSGSELKELRIGREDRPLGLWLKGFGQDSAGEVYILGSTNLGPSGTSGRVLRLAPVPNMLAVAGAAESGTNLMVSVTNNLGPVVVQTTPRIEEPVWRTLSVTTNGAAAVPLGGSAGFFRAADTAGNAPLPFTVYMTGAAERPEPIQTPGIGTGTLSLEGDTLYFDIQYGGLTTPATAAHIHGPARASESAGVLINLAPFNGGAFGTNGTLSGSVTLTPEQKALILEGRTYVNVHTEANGGGEIRGQIAPVAFAAALSGAAERPDPVESPGGGLGTFLLTGNMLTFNITYGGLTGAARAAHIHGPANLDESAAVLVDLAPFNGGAFGINGTLSGTIMLTPDQLAHLVDGRTYANVHTEQNGGGEIRGQILPQPIGIPLSAVLSGAAERPEPVQTAGNGLATFVLDGNTLHFNVSYGQLTSPAMAAHIHGPASTSESTGVLINLAPFNGGAFGTNGTLSGSVVLTEQQRKWVLEGRTYVNVHTVNHGGGEIRGQIAPSLMRATLSGAFEQPAPVPSEGRGTAHFLVAGDQLAVNATYAGLSSAATAAHIHGPATRSQATEVLTDLQPVHQGAFEVSGAFAGRVSLSPEALAALIDGLTYMNIHSGMHGSGEIRGQVVR